MNIVVPRSKVLSTAISLAQQITNNSPDSVQSSKVALLLSQKHNHQETFTAHNLSPESRRVYKGANIKVSFLFISFLFYKFYILNLQEGLKAFTEVSFYSTRGFFAGVILLPCSLNVFRNVRQNGRILQNCKHNNACRYISSTQLSKSKVFFIVQYDMTHDIDSISK